MASWVCSSYHLVGIVVKAASRAADCSMPTFGVDLFPHQCKLAIQWPPRQAPGACPRVSTPLDLQPPSQCGSTHNCPSMTVPETHQHAAETSSNRQTTTPAASVATLTMVSRSVHEVHPKSSQDTKKRAALCSPTIEHLRDQRARDRCSSLCVTHFQVRSHFIS